MAEAVMYDERGEPAGMAPDQKFDWESYRAQARAKSLRQQENQRIAEQEVSDRQWMDMLQQNAATQDAAKAVAAALQFQAIRGYERDLRSAKSAGLSEEQAAIQALIRNPRAVSGTGLARTISELRPTFEPASTNLPGVGPVVRSGRYGERVQIVPPEKPEPQPRVTLMPPDPMQGRLQPSFQISGPPASVMPYATSMGITNFPGSSPVSSPKTATGPVRVNSKAERDALKPGTVYIGPDGREYTRK